MLLALDEGTTGTRAVVLGDGGEFLAVSAQEITQHYPQPGWVEHDATEIWERTRAAAIAALADAGAGPGDVHGIGITNQRETVVVWDPATGEPLHRAIVWQDRRTAARCAQLEAAGHAPFVRLRTGLHLDPYFSATKIEWMLHNVDGLADRARTGRAVFGTIDSWLIFGLTGEHVTDPSNASRTLLYDILDGAWSPVLCDLLGVPIDALPGVRPSCGVLGTVRGGALPGHDGVPVAGVAGDQQAALFGQACLAPGEGKHTYGTGGFLVVNAGAVAPPPVPGLLTSIAWQIGTKVTYALEASIFIAGAAVQWLRDELGIIADAAESETLARSLPDNGGVYMVPAFTGLGSPHFDPYARGTIVGLTRGSGRAHLARAALEAIAYQTVDAVRAVEQATGRALTELRVDGGAVHNGFLMQFQADVLGIPVVVPEVTETTVLGAAALAAVATNIWTLDRVRETWREAHRYEPVMAPAQRDALLADWARALERSAGWARPQDGP
jgi:glycerol kinase